MWQTRDYSGVLDALEEGARFSFRLRANPVHSISSDASRQTKPVAHASVKYQQAWLLDRCRRNGFEIPDGPDGAELLRIVERGVMRFGRSGGHRVTIGYATFEGVLQVTDTESLRRALVSGIGRAKAYGCGLLTLAAPPGL